jgi:hypothetical protein
VVYLVCSFFSLEEVLFYFIRVERDREWLLVRFTTIELVCPNAVTKPLVNVTIG